jgi:hypothetical protein
MRAVKEQLIAHPFILSRSKEMAKTKRNLRGRRRTLRRKRRGGSQSLQIPVAAIKVSDGGLNTDNSIHHI